MHVVGAAEDEQGQGGNVVDEHLPEVLTKHRRYSDVIRTSHAHLPLDS